MVIVIDTSALLAVVLGEPERDAVIALTEGAQLTAPTALPFEVGNAISSLCKRGRLEAGEGVAVLRAFESIPLQLRHVDIAAAIALAERLEIYAYDAYFLQLSLTAKLPLLTLDAGMKRSAAKLGLGVLEELR